MTHVAEYRAITASPLIVVVLVMMVAYRWIGSYAATFGVLAIVAVTSALLAAFAVRAGRAA